MKVFGMRDHSGMGKTLLERLVPELRSRDLLVSLIKRGHKDIEIGSIDCRRARPTELPRAGRAVACSLIVEREPAATASASGLSARAAARRAEHWRCRPAHLLILA